MGPAKAWGVAPHLEGPQGGEEGLTWVDRLRLGGMGRTSGSDDLGGLPEEIKRLDVDDGGGGGGRPLGGETAAEEEEETGRGQWSWASSSWPGGGSSEGSQMQGGGSTDDRGSSDDGGSSDDRGSTDDRSSTDDRGSISGETELARSGEADRLPG